MKKIILSIITVVGLFLISSCGNNTENQIQTDKIYEFDKIEVVFKDNPTSILTFYNVFEKENVFLLEDNTNIVISNLNWYKTYKNKEYEEQEEQEKLELLASIFSGFLTMVFCIFLLSQQ